MARQFARSRHVQKCCWGDVHKRLTRRNCRNRHNSRGGGGHGDGRSLALPPVAVGMHVLALFVRLNPQLRTGHHGIAKGRLGGAYVLEDYKGVALALPAATIGLAHPQEAWPGPAGRIGRSTR